MTRSRRSTRSPDDPACSAGRGRYEAASGLPFPDPNETDGSRTRSTLSSIAADGRPTGKPCPKTSNENPSQGVRVLQSGFITLGATDGNGPIKLADDIKPPTIICGCPRQDAGHRSK